MSTGTLFDIDSEDGTIIAKPGLDTGVYSVNVSVSDGKFVSYSVVKVDVVLISEDAVRNSIILTIRDMSADDFVTSYRKSLLKAVRNIMNVRTKDVFIISIQPQMKQSATFTSSAASSRSSRQTLAFKKAGAIQPNWRVRESGRHSRNNLDILFAVQKPAGGFYPPNIVRKQLTENIAELESTLGHRIVGTVQVTHQLIHSLEHFIKLSYQLIAIILK